MKWDVIVTTEKGTFSLGTIVNGYKTKKEAEKGAAAAAALKETISAVVVNCQKK